MLKLPALSLSLVVSLVACMDANEEPVSATDKSVAEALSKTANELANPALELVHAIETITGGLQIEDFDNPSAVSCPSVSRDNQTFKDYTLTYTSCQHSESGATLDGTVKIHLDVEVGPDGKKYGIAVFSSDNLTRDGVAITGEVKVSTNVANTFLDANIAYGPGRLAINHAAAVINRTSLTLSGSGTAVQSWTGPNPTFEDPVTLTITTEFTMADVVLENTACFPTRGTIELEGTPAEKPKLQFALDGRFENGGVTVKLTFPELGPIGDVPAKFYPLDCI